MQYTHRCGLLEVVRRFPEHVRPGGTIDEPEKKCGSFERKIDVQLCNDVHRHATGANV